MSQNESHRHKALLALSHVHRALGHLHDFRPEGDLGDFVREGELNRVIAYEMGDTLEIGVELKEDFLKRIQSILLPEHFHLDRLADIAIAIEELSHLHTFMWKAQNDQEVSRLELEIQGELDKLWLVLQWLEERNEAAFAETVFERLLGDCQLGAHVEMKDRALYEDAHQLARRIGRGLMDKSNESRKKMAEDFFRLSGHQKLHFKIE